MPPSPHHILTSTRAGSSVGLWQVEDNGAGIDGAVCWLAGGELLNCAAGEEGLVRGAVLITVQRA